MKSFKPILTKPAFYRRILMVAMIVLVLVRPHLSSEDVKRELTNLNIWFVVDATGSMIGKDIEGNSVRRYEKAQTDITDIIAKIPGARYGIIAQDFSSYVASPMSSNADSTISAETYLKPKTSLYARPTNLSDILSFATKKIATYQKRYPKRSNVMVFMSDGEDVSGESLTIPGELLNTLDGVAVLGYGSATGTRLEYVGYDPDATIDEDRFVTYYNKDRGIEVDSSFNVISKINESNLKKIASALQGNYYHRENGSVPSEIIDGFTRIALSKPTESTDESTSMNGEIYWIFAIILLVLLLWECEETVLKLLSEREVKHA